MRNLRAKDSLRVNSLNNNFTHLPHIFDMIKMDRFDISGVKYKFRSIIIQLEYFLNKE